jgi:predicted nucleic acid-binding protein
MDHVADTNILLRSLQRSHPMYRIAWDALKTIHRRGDRLCIFAQNIVEFWGACTRPVAGNGLGLGLSDTSRYTSRLEALFLLLPDTPEIYREWRRLVLVHAVSGTKVHDARLVAAMNVHGVKSILTFNTEDFARYTDIRAVHPNTSSLVPSELRTRVS